MSFQQWQLHFEIVPPSFIITCVGLQPRINWYVHYLTCRRYFNYYTSKLPLLKRYIISTRIVESANVDWVDYCGSVGGSMGTGWVLLRQAERDRRAFKANATKYSLLQCKYSTLETSLHIVSMDLQHPNCLCMHCAGSGVLLVATRCSWPLKT